MDKKKVKRSCNINSSSGRCVNSTKKSKSCFRNKATKRCRHKAARKCSFKSTTGRCVNGNKASSKCKRNPKTLRCRKVSKKQVARVKKNLRSMKSHGETTGFDTSYEEAMKYLEDFSSGKDMHADTKVKKKLRKMNTQSDHSKAFDDSYGRAMRDLRKMAA